MKARLVRLRCFVLTMLSYKILAYFVDVVCFFSLRLRVAVFLNATRSDRSVHRLPLREGGKTEYEIDWGRRRLLDKGRL